jgi:hypothetical protein
MTISLAFLAPDLVKAAIDGRLPHGMGVARGFAPVQDRPDRQSPLIHRNVGAVVTAVAQLTFAVLRELIACADMD